jgi:hypothetical protein
MTVGCRRYSAVSNLREEALESSVAVKRLTSIGGCGEGNIEDETERSFLIGVSNLTAKKKNCIG